MKCVSSYEGDKERIQELILSIGGAFRPSESIKQYLKRIIREQNLTYKVSTLNAVWLGRHWNANIERILTIKSLELSEQWDASHPIEAYRKFMNRSPALRSMLMAIYPEGVYAKEHLCFEEAIDVLALVGKECLLDNKIYLNEADKVIELYLGIIKDHFISALIKKFEG